MKAKQILKTIPHEPGVYMMKDENGKIMYIGKAKDLKKRVSSYFNKDGGHNYQTKIMARSVCDIDFIVTDSEQGAKILEANLIKFNQPEFNIDLKDGKHYPYIKITNEQYPTISMVRNRYDENARYYGPFTSVMAVRTTIEFFVTSFRIRRCKRMQKKGCIKRQIQLCSGPCTKPEENEDYKERIAIIEGLLRGRKKGLIKKLESMMKRRTKELRFEEAASLRDIILGLKALQPVQKVAMIPESETDFMVINTDPDRDPNLHCMLIFKVRDGDVISENFFFVDPSKVISEDAPLLNSLAYQYYSSAYIPKKIVINKEDTSDPDSLADVLSQIKGEKVRIITNPKGKTKELLELAKKNALLKIKAKPTRSIEDTRIRTTRDPHEEMTMLKDDLEMDHLPYRIEAFDISNLQKDSAVGSMVCFIDGRPHKKDYRHYRIKTVTGQNDFEMIKEIVFRRYSKHPIPDLILIDGGSIQLDFATQALDELGILNYNVMGLAKRKEEIWLPGREEPLSLPHSRPSLLLLARVRDEAHRFAITFHRKKRAQRTMRSELDGIPGLGEDRKLVLLRRFGSVKKIKQASKEDLMKVKGIGEKLAQTILEHLKS